MGSALGRAKNDVKTQLASAVTVVLTLRTGLQLLDGEACAPPPTKNEHVQHKLRPTASATQHSTPRL